MSDPHRRGLFVRVLVLSLLFLLQPWNVQGAQDVWEGVERIVAIGDVHGDHEQFVAVLKSAGLINAEQDWVGGKTHLVQTGDILDRGPDSRKVMDLLMRLERQAGNAGGYVHSLIGNHEAMNVYGDLRYVSPGEYAAFRDQNSERVREVFYEAHVEKVRKSPPPEGLPTLNEAYRSEWESRHPLGYFEHRMHFGPDGTYGTWIRRHNAVVKINDTIFLHGGISPQYAHFSIREINDQVRKELTDFRRRPGGIVTDPEGPLWYRGLAREVEKDSASHVEAVLENYGARRIVIAHTLTPGAILPRFESRVILIEVGLPKSNGGRLACLVIEKNQAYALHRGTMVALPTGPGPGLLSYLTQVAALEPDPSPLERLIQRLERQLGLPVP